MVREICETWDYMDSPDPYELRRLLFDTAHRYFDSNPFRRDALINQVQRNGRSLGWWLTEPDHSGNKRGTKGSAAMIEEAFSDLVQRGAVIQVEKDCWRLTVSSLEDA